MIPPNVKLNINPPKKAYNLLKAMVLYLNFYSIQWNLSIADMLYIRHLSIADTILRNQLYPAMLKPLYFEPLYSGHLSIADTFSENQWCPLLRGFTVVKLLVIANLLKAKLLNNVLGHIRNIPLSWYQII